MRNRAVALLATLLVTQLCAAQIVEVPYEGVNGEIAFTIWLDCQRAGAVRFEYFVEADVGKLPRKHSFHLDEDPAIEDGCQQTSAETYSGAPEGYDRGHLVPANHLDHDAKAIDESNFMTNILPQHRNMNRGAWLQTEEVIECIRDISTLHVIGGVIWGRNPHDDYFLESHNVRTPDYFWKVVIREDSGDAIAWLIPNVGAARRNQLDKYIITLSELEDMVGEQFPVSRESRNRVHLRSWQKPNNCNLS